MDYVTYDQHLVVSIHHAPTGTIGAEALMGTYQQELREEVAWWFGSGAMLALRIDPAKVYLECCTSRSRCGDTEPDITIAITGKVVNNSERKLAVALDEIHEYLRGFPVYQQSLLVRIELGGVFLTKYSQGVPFDPKNLRRKPVRHWRARAVLK